jgi:hypothetical protein
MTIVIIHHMVKDYSAWRPVYDAHAQSRVSAGITNGRVFRGVEDPNDIMLVFDVGDVAKARTWSVSADLKFVMAQAGVSSRPAIYFIG